ncbi:MAG: IPT/TIG domain-containing protein, partial [Dehalococcoidia bacterium]
TILPNITIDTITGAAGTTVTVIGHGFALSEKNINVTYDSTSVKSSITADEEGTWTTSFTVPTSIKGKHAIGAYGDTTATTAVSNKTFTVSPTVTISPTTGGVGTVITVVGAGFASSESSIKVLYSDTEVRTGITADTTGSWSTSFTVPSSTRGSHTIGVQGSITASTDVAAMSFTVAPAIVCSQSTGSVDDEIKVSGNGFANNESSIQLTFDDKPLATNIIADDNGYWTATTKIPAASGGTHTIGASGRITLATDVTTVPFTIESILSVLPKNGNVGDDLKVSGSGFTASKDFSVTWNNSAIASGTVNDSGIFQTDFKAPGGKNGAITITATDSKGITASTVFNMDTTPPDVPQISSPRDGATVGFMGDTKVAFKWTDVSDPSGVTYDLEVSDESNFSKTLVSQTKLSDSKYTLSEAESLPNGEYYWRIRAVDGATNTSAWSPTASVKVGFITLSTIIWIIVGVLALIIVVAVLNRVLRSKPKKKRRSDWE